MILLISSRLDIDVFDVTALYIWAKRYTVRVFKVTSRRRNMGRAGEKVDLIFQFPTLHTPFKNSSNLAGPV